MPTEYNFEPGCEDFVIVASRIGGFSIKGVDLNAVPDTPVYVLLPMKLPEHLGAIIAGPDYRHHVWGEVYGLKNRPARYPES